MNVETTQDILDELSNMFRYNDAVLRNMVIRCNEAVAEVSPIKAAESREERKPRREERTEQKQDNSSADDSSEEAAEE
jgi:small subunit ribosomal protein S6